MSKRGYGTYASPIVINGGGKRSIMGRTKLRARRRVVPGVTRVGGYYGRYAYGGPDGELKFHDVDVDDATVAIGGTIQNTGSINLIPQGITEKTRVGRKCNIRSIGWRYQLELTEQIDGATPPQCDVVRVILYLDKQANGATATVSGILESDDYQSFNNLANSQRFRILLDKTHSLSRRTLSATQNADTFDSAQVFFNYQYFKKCNIPLEFDSTAGAITEIRSNNLGVLLVGLNGVAAFVSKFRLRFSDN